MTYKPSHPYWEDAPKALPKPPTRLTHDSATPEGRRELRAALAAHNATVGKPRPSPNYDPTKVDPRARYKPTRPYWAESGEVGGVGQLDERDRQTFRDVRPSLPSNNREVDAILAEARMLIAQLGGPTRKVTNRAKPKNKPSRYYWQD